jgi:hypothetical protein
MVRLLQRALETVAQQQAQPGLRAADRLRAVVRWALQLQLDGEMPSLPSQNSSLRAELMASKAYLELLLQLSEAIGPWIVQAQEDGDIDPALPPEVVLYTIYARACDPVLAICMNGLRGAASAARPG